MNRQGMASLKWLEFNNHILNIQRDIFLTETHFDVILKVDNIELKSHRCILSAASTFFETIFKDLTDEIVTVIIPDVEYNILLSILRFVYTGESLIDPNCLSKFLEASTLLKIKGLMSYGGTVNGIYIEGSQILEPNDEFIEEIIEETVEVDENIEYLDDSEFSQYIDVIEDEDSSIINEDTEIEKEEISYLSTADSLTYIEPNESTESVNLEEGSSSKRIKQYDEISLADALNELKNGHDLKNIVTKYKIPRSTLYMKSKQYFKDNGNGPKISKYKQIDQAVKAIVNKELSFNQAQIKYKIPKSILWRRVNKCSDYKSDRREMSATKLAAIEALQNGESLSKFSFWFNFEFYFINIFFTATIANKYSLPISTLHREKIKLFNEGKLKNVQIKRQNKGQTFRDNLIKAVMACKEGMSQASAAYKYKVPKTTIWRHLKVKIEPQDDTIDE